MIADLIDDFTGLRAEMRQVPVAGEQRGLRYVRAGLFSDAETAISRDLSRQGYAETARGELAMRRGQTRRAIDQLQRGIDLARAHGYAERYLAAESLANIFVRTGRSQDAIRTLESAVRDAPRFSMNGLTGGFWLRTLERLARLYRAVGRAAEADALDRRLRDVLAIADADHPLVRYLDRTRTAGRDRGGQKDHEEPYRER